MRIHNAVCMTGLAIALLLAPSGSAVAGQKQDDWKTLTDLVRKLDWDFSSQSYLKEKGEAFAKEWASWKKEYEPFMARFKERYGTTPDQVEAAFEGIERPLGVNQDVVQAFRRALDIDVSAEQKKFAGWAAELGREAYNRWANFNVTDPQKMELKLDYTERAVRYFNLAKALNPEGDYGDLIKQAEAARKKTRPEWEKAAKSLKWPGPNKDFAGPGDPKKLAVAALEYLSKNTWSKPEYDDVHVPIAAVVTGKDWVVSKRVPITQVPTQYSLDFLVAFAGKKDPTVAYCYHMVLYTREEAGVKKGLPFRYANSRQYAKYKMPLSALPKRARAIAAMVAKGQPVDDVYKTGGRSRPSQGVFGLIVRLALAGVLLLSGLVAAAPFLKRKLPAVAPVCDGLTPYGPAIGILALVVGLFAFLRALLFFFAPLTDLLPQALAVILGLALGKDILMRKAPEPPPAGEAQPEGDTAGEAQPAGEKGETAVDKAKEAAEAAAHKAQEVLLKNRERIEKLRARLVPLGIAALALAVIHLLFGGIRLF